MTQQFFSGESPEHHRSDKRQGLLHFLMADLLHTVALSPSASLSVKSTLQAEEQLRQTLVIGVVCPLGELPSEAPLRLVRGVLSIDP